MVTKNCKNIKTKKYTGKENSPLGRGYHAMGEKIGKKMMGTNNSMYIVIKTKNGKRWQKLKNNKKKTTKYGIFESVNTNTCQNCHLCRGNLFDLIDKYGIDTEKNLNQQEEILSNKAICKHICNECIKKLKTSDQKEKEKEQERINQSIDNLLDYRILKNLSSE